MDSQGIGRAYEGIMRLAMIGAVAITVGSIGAAVGLIALAWWAWNHLSVTVK